MSLEFASNPVPHSLSPPVIPPSLDSSSLHIFTIPSLAMDCGLLVFSQVITLVFLYLTFPLHHNNLQFPSCYFPDVTPSVVSYCYQQFFSRGWGSFESLGKTRNSLLHWTIHSHCRTLSIPGYRLLKYQQKPPVIVVIKKCTHTSPDMLRCHSS